MRVLLVSVDKFYYVGAFFRRALEELGYEYAFVDEGKFLEPLKRSLLHKLAYRLLGRRPLTYWAFNKELLQKAQEFQPDVVLVTKGAHISPRTLVMIKKETGAFLVNYATDDPFNLRVSSRDLVRAIPLYDLYACTKRAIMGDVRRAGCQNVVFVRFGYEPTLHFPEKPATPEEIERFSSDVVFIGNADRDRVPYFEALARIPGLRLHLYGGYWDRHPLLRRYHRGFALGRDYRLALGGAKIAVCLVRRANRDGHCMRTFEIPACGAFMLAERTEEHLELFEEDKEAAYFESPEGLVEKVQYYLQHEEERQRIAKAGYRKVIEGKHAYKDRLAEILNIARGILSDEF
ncbi:MAG: hypothetical protein DRG83_01055 [Deltaproteobacteria bacterium]|nr:MAG: hypothetical protein DRG83_01055 [Deltaproteobacteria bacterium]RLF12986.1 MAG: hypothetical protein DRJ69_00030 [Thermoprotei archaeon]